MRYWPSRTSRPSTETFAHDQRYRKLVRHRASPYRALEGMSFKKTALAMTFKLAEAAEKSWRRLGQLPKVILGAKVSDGIEVVRSQAQAAAA